jgi:ribonucleoside-diphosphate reductase alpha chain
MTTGSIFVVKRDGSKEPYQHEKIQRQIQYACEGISNVSQSMIELNMNLELYNGISTDHIDQLAINSASKLINTPDGDVNYQYVAGRLRSSVLRKEVYGSFTPPRLYDLVCKNIDAGMYTPELLEWYTEDEWDLMESFVDHTKDEKYSFAAISQLIDKYLVRNKVTRQLYETPQVRYIVAAAVAYHAETKNRLKMVNEYYKTASNGEFTLPTPVLAGLGTPTKQFSSCVLLRSDDTLDSIFATGEMMAKYAAKRAGIGLEFGRIRPAGSAIRGGEVSHTGLTPFIKKWFADLRSCSQGGIRNASCTAYYPIWHYEFEELIVLKNNAGTEENRVRHLDYNVVTSKFFWRRFKRKENITFFDPNEVPDLYEAFYADTAKFEKLYEKYEKKAGLRKRVLPAALVFKMILKERTDTGRIYLTFIDNVQNGPIDPTLHPIYQSNLCAEILIPSVPFQRLDDPNGRIALCTLGSINWGKFKKPEEMRAACRMVVRSLSNILDYQDFLSIQSKLANDDFKPLGIGITNLAYWHAKRKLEYGSPEALAEVKRWMEHQAFYLTEASVDLAEERGPCLKYKDTCYGRGIFPWEKRAAGSNELTDFTPSLPWEPLRARMLVWGIHNGLLMAIAPVESSSVAVESTNGIAIPMALISTKESKGGSLVQVVPEYHKLKSHYQLLWEQKDCIGYLKTAAALAVYVDQSISTDTFYNPKHFPKGKIPATLIAKNLMLFQHWGGKTVYYSLVNKMGTKMEAENVPLVEEPSLIDFGDEEGCSGCVL